MITYGANPQADIRFSDHLADGAVSVFNVTIHDRKSGEETRIEDLRLPMPGRHNVSNATAAIAVAHELGISAEDIRRGLASFGGVKRRFTHVGSWKGVEIFDDYAHHPVEIRAVLKAARESCSGRVFAVAQPHRFTRLHDLFEDFASCFNNADRVIIAPVYTAGEDPIEGVTSEALVERIKAGGHRSAIFAEGPEKIARILAEDARPGDFVVFLGAGSITYWANGITEMLEKTGGNR
jgi:UDP-N-acetylmuramate--alanine ligase